MFFCPIRLRVSRFIFGCVLALSCAASAIAQTTGTITGTVTDSTGAAVPGATVTVTNVATKVARTVKSDAAGRYTASALNNGSYNITATAANFKLTDLKGVNLDIAQVLSENLTLAVGASNEEISVEAQAITTDTETSSNGTTITTEAVAELPLANRQFYNLVETAPGVAPPAQNSSMGFRGGMNINGAPETANDFTVNGTFNVDLGTNQNSFRPSVDTIQEFKVLSGTYSAEYGRMQGGQVIIVTKQGSNKFHGSLYEFIRNGAIEARPWSPAAALPGSKSPAFRQNTFGATVGGPILKDKAFFFFGYEGQRIASEFAAQSEVPTTWTMGIYDAATNSMDNTGGCLPGTVQAYDPATGSALPLTNTGACAGAPGSGGFDITSGSALWQTNAISSNSSYYGRLLAGLVYPEPTGGVTSAGNNPTGKCATNALLTCLSAPTSNNYNFDEIRTENMDEYNSRVDFKLSDKDSFYGGYNHFTDPAFEPSNSLCSSRTLPNMGCFTNQISTLANIGETHIFTANLLNVFVFGYDRLVQPRIQQDNTSIGTKWPGLPNAFTGTLANNLGTPSVTPPTSSYTTTGGPNNLPQDRWDNHFDIDDTITWTHKAHTFKAGTQILIAKMTASPSGSRGSLTFNSSTLKSDQAPNSAACPNCATSGTTGDPIGDLLLGLPVSAGQTPTAPKTYLRYNSFDYFVMDDWKVASNFTLNLGIRWEFDLPFSDKYGQSTFSTAAGDALIGAGVTQGPLAVGQVPGAMGVGNPLGNFVLSETAGQKSLYQTDRHAIAPRIGFAWQPFHNDKTVVKAAYGTYFATPQSYNEFQSYSTQFPIRYSKTFSPAPWSGGAGALFLATEFPTGNVSGSLPTPGSPYCVSGAAGCNAPNPANAICAAPCSQIPVVTGTQVDPHYTTAQADQWTLGIQRQLTGSILGEVVYFGNKGTHLAYGGNAVLNPNANPLADISGQNYTTNNANSATATTITTASPNISYSAISAANLQALRVYPQWGSIGVHKTGYNSEYESLQARVQISSKKGATVLVSYTYGKSEDGVSTSAQNPINQAGDKGLSPFDIRHRLVISPVYPLPFGKGRQWLNTGLGSAILGGFQISGIYQYFTGRPFSITDSTNQSGSAGGGDRPDLIAGQNLNGRDTLNNTPIHTKTEWFNIHAVAYNPPGTFGNVAPYAIEGPGYDEMDLTLGRTFPIKEWAKLQLKLDAFNLFNHPNLYNPTASFAGTPTYLKTTTATTVATGATKTTTATASGFTSLAYPTQPGYCTTNTTAVTSGCTAPGTFGTITQANGMREIQASIHISF
jgi:hypothetical protein